MLWPTELSRLFSIIHNFKKIKSFFYFSPHRFAFFLLFFLHSKKSSSTSPLRFFLHPFFLLCKKKKRCKKIGWVQKKWTKSWRTTLVFYKFFFCFSALYWERSNFLLKKAIPKKWILKSLRIINASFSKMKTY